MKVADLMGLLFEVGKAFGTLAADAERIAHGGRAEVDVDGRLSTLAERARAAAGEVKAEVNPLAEFGRALATLDELGGEEAPAVNGEAWGLFQDEFNKSRKGGWKLLATPREVAAWRLSADCRGLAKCASVLAFAHGLVDTTRGWCRGRVTEAEEKVATAEAEMHRARAGELEALAERYAEGSAERTAMEKQAAEERRAAASDKARAAALASQAEPWKGAGELLVKRIREMEERFEEERKGHCRTEEELARLAYVDGQKTREEVGGKVDAVRKDLKQTDEAVVEIADAKTRKRIQAKRTLREQGLTRKDRDLQNIFRDIDAELKEQAKRGEKTNKRKAVRAVLSRPGCQRTVEELASIYREYNREKRRRRRKK